MFVFGGLAGSNVGPGEFTLRLRLGKKSVETSATILPNPVITSSSEDFKEQQQFLINIESVLRDMHSSVNMMRSAKSQLKHYATLLKGNKDAKSLLDKGKALLKRINSWEEHLIQEKQKTFQDVINFNNKLNSQLIRLMNYIDQADPKVTRGAKQRYDDLMKDWNLYKNERDAIIKTGMKAYNELYRSLNLPALILRKK